MKYKYTDTKRLNALEALATDKIVCRWSSTGRGWRLHETRHADLVNDATASCSIRDAIDVFLDEQVTAKPVLKQAPVRDCPTCRYSSYNNATHTLCGVKCKDLNKWEAVKPVKK